MWRVASSSRSSPALGRHRLHLDIAATSDSPAVRGDLELDGASSSAPLSVSTKLPRGSMYSWKQVFAVSGSLEVGGRTGHYEPQRDLAIVAETPFATSSASSPSTTS